jgi:hypothetical protein
MRSPLRALGRALTRAQELVEPARALVARPSTPSPITTDEPPPVVARLVVEIRSDGSRTIARGAMEDVASGEQVAISAEGGTPGQLAASLAKAMLSIPLMALQASRSSAGPRRRGMTRDGPPLSMAPEDHPRRNTEGDDVARNPDGE